MSGSATIIGDAFIVLNTDTPTLRYAGIEVTDSGSGGTASLQWDGDVDQWLVVDEGRNTAYLMTGPTGSLGNEISLTDNKLPKSGLGNQLVDSSITDNGSYVTIAAPLVVNELTASGLNYPSVDNGEKSFIQTDGNGNLSLQYVDTIWENVYAGVSVPKGTPLYISGSQGANPKVYPADAGDVTKMPVVFVAGENYTVGEVYPAIVLGLIEGIDLTGYVTGQSVYVAEGGGWSTSLPSGSASITQALGIITKGGSGGKGLVLNPGPAQLPGLGTGNIWVGNGNNRPIEIPSSSLVVDITALNSFTSSQEDKNNAVGTVTQSLQEQLTNIGLQSGSWDDVTDITALNAFTASQEDKDTTLGTYTGSNDDKWNTLSGETGSYARTNASNTFTDVNVFNSTSSFANTIRVGNPITAPIFGQLEINNVSSSLVLASPGAANGLSGLNHIQSTFADQVNLMFKSDNTQATTIINGSGNIFHNPTAPLAGFNRYMTALNIFTAGGAVPQISQSMAFSPTIAANVGAGSITMRGPVSASAWNINNNVNNGAITFGQSAANNAEKLTSTVTVSGNVLASTANLSFIANQTALTGSAVNANGNIMAAGATLIMSSSATTFSQNYVGTATTVRNAFFNGSPGLGSVQLVNNQLVGATTVEIRGEQAAGTTNLVAVNNNTVGGGGNIIYPNTETPRIVGTTAYHQALRNFIFGSNLVITGSSLSTDAGTLGSAFLGRNAVDDGIRNKTSDTVFSVGTGTSTTVRKTGFLIDSGSNTFVEGTLNVSGSTTFNGSISDTVTVLSIAGLTASLDASVGNTFQLSLVDATDTRLEVSNARQGQTVNLLVSQSAAGTGTLSFGSNLYESSGSFYSASVVANAKDIITLATFVETNVIYVANIKNLIL